VQVSKKSAKFILQEDNEVRSEVEVLQKF